MKKILCLFGALTFALTSCSSDDDSSGSVLLKKEIKTDSEGDKVTTNHEYNGNKIVKSTVNGSTDGTYFTYTGNLITKMEFKYDNQLEHIDTYTYDSSNRLITYVSIAPLEEEGFKEVYTYNADGSISVQVFTGDEVTQTISNGTRKITFVGGEITTIVSTETRSYSYTYDDKNNPFVNVLGYKEISFVDGTATGISHNILTEKDIDYDAVITKYVYTYNSAGYPTKSVNDIDDEISTTEYFY